MSWRIYWRLLILGLICLVLAPVLGAVAIIQEIETVTIKAFVIGPGPMGVKKATNLELAAEYLNRLLEACGANIRVKAEVEFSELKWEPFAEKFYLDFAAGKAPDIVTLRETADLAEGGFIVPMTDLVRAFWDLNYYDFYPRLWEGAKWKGEIWGVPHDHCPGGIWYRKDVLRALGYTDAEIRELLPENGNTTLEVVARLAKEAVNAGLVEYGILHRPSPGIEYPLLLAFGATVYDHDKGVLILDKPAVLRYLQWHRDMVEQGVIPPAPPPWATIHGTFVEGKTFSTWASHVGTPAEWMAKYGLSEKTLEEDLGFLPFPPTENAKAKGVGPVSPDFFPLYFVTSQSKHPELAKLLIMFGTSVEANAIHSAFALRPPSRVSALDHPLIRDIGYIQRIAPAVETTLIPPPHPLFSAYQARIFEALKGVEAGIVTPERAVEDLVAWFLAEVPDGLVIE